jgi:hypothetical protein
MLFQTLDDKNECVGVFVDGQLHFEDLPTGLTKTWKYASYLEDQDVEYASLYCLGKDLSEVCPEHLKDDFDRITTELKAFLVSFRECKISLEEN